LIINQLGAIEAELSLLIEDISSKQESRIQPATLAFAKCLTIIPKFLASNAGYDPTEETSKLLASHTRCNHNPQDCNRFGLTMMSEEDSKAALIVAPSAITESYIQLATQTAATILKVDQIFYKT
jgi:chaperonin GroEL (HSP60 family)